MDIYADLPSSTFPDIIFEITRGGWKAQLQAQGGYMRLAVFTPLTARWVSAVTECGPDLVQAFFTEMTNKVLRIMQEEYSRNRCGLKVVKEED